MKKLVKLGSVVVETRNNVRGNVPDGGLPIVTSPGRCIVPQRTQAGAGATFTATTAC